MQLEYREFNLLQLTRRCFWFILAASCWEDIFFQIWSLIAGFTFLLTLSSFPSDFANALFAANTSQAPAFSVTSQRGKISVLMGSDDQGSSLVAVNVVPNIKSCCILVRLNMLIINGWLKFHSIYFGYGDKSLYCWELFFADYGDESISSIWMHYIYIHYKHKATEDIFT